MIENDYIRKGVRRNEATIVHTLEEKCAILWSSYCQKTTPYQLNLTQVEVGPYLT